MNVLNIIKKEIKQNLREKKGNTMMVLFPMLLMVILGMALSGFFKNNIELDDVKVLYTNNGGKVLSEAFSNFVEYGEKMGTIFEETKDVQKGMESVKNAGYSCYILIEDSPQQIKLYKNDRYNFEANFVGAMLKSFVQRYNTIVAIASENPLVVGELAGESQGGGEAEYVRVTSLDRDRQPSSKDYYAVTVLTMILMYASLTGFWSIKSEKNMKTGDRMLCSPVKRHEILTGKVLGSIFITIIQFLLVILFSKYVLKAYWGANIGIILLIVLAEAIMAVSLGTGIAFAIKSEGAAMGVLNTIIPLVIFLGGGYVPVDVFSSILLKLSKISPIRWVNRAIFDVIYRGDFSLVPIAIAINLSLAALFIVTSLLISRKEAV